MIASPETLSSVTRWETSQHRSAHQRFAETDRYQEVVDLQLVVLLLVVLLLVVLLLVVLLLVVLLLVVLLLVVLLLVVLLLVVLLLVVLLLVVLLLVVLLLVVLLLLVLLLLVLLLLVLLLLVLLLLVLLLLVLLLLVLLLLVLLLVVLLLVVLLLLVLLLLVLLLLVLLLLVLLLLVLLSSCYQGKHSALGRGVARELAFRLHPRRRISSAFQCSTQRVYFGKLLGFGWQTVRVMVLGKDSRRGHPHPLRRNCHRRPHAVVPHSAAEPAALSCRENRLRPQIEAQRGLVLLSVDHLEQSMRMLPPR
jgi:hypothetical protein